MAIALLIAAFPLLIIPIAIGLIAVVIVKVGWLELKKRHAARRLQDNSE